MAGVHEIRYDGYRMQTGLAGPSRCWRMTCCLDRNLCACCVERVVDLRRKEVRIRSLALRREAKQLVNHWAHQLSELMGLQGDAAVRYSDPLKAASTH